MTPRVAAATSYLDALRIYVTSNLDFIGAHRREIIAFTEIVNGMPPGGSDPPPYLEGHRSAVEDLKRLFEAGQAAGEFGEFSAFVTAVSLRASVDAISGLLRADPAMDVDAYGAELLGLYERAVRA